MTDVLRSWLSLPVDALQASSSPLWLLALGFAFGAVHGLLPGHGKALLAARHAMSFAAAPAPGRSVTVILDGLALAGARALVAVALVLVSVEAARGLGFTVSVEWLRRFVGVLLVAMAVHVLWHVRLHVPSIPSGGARTPLASSPATQTSAPGDGAFGAPLLALALVPEPVAMVVASFGVAQHDMRAAALLVLGLVLGLGGTIGTAALLAARGARRLAPASRLRAHASLALAVILALSGAVILLDLG